MATQLVDEPVTQLIEPPRMTAVEPRATKLSFADVHRRISVAEYHRMHDAAVFGHSPRMELLEGVIVAKMTKNTPHIIATDKVEDFLHFVLPRGSGYCITMGNPLTIEEHDSEPEPDAMVLRGTIDNYLDRRRGPADVALLIEVSDTSYDVDRFPKWSLYAAARVAIYWIVDLNRDRLEVHTDPAGQGESAFYARSTIYDQLDQPVPLIIEGREVTKFPLRDILPIKNQARDATPPAGPQ